MLLALEDVQKDYGAQPVLLGVSLQINPGDRIGLVGRNGAGKSTLLRLLLGAEKADAGTIRIFPGVRVGNLTQDPSFPPESTVSSVMEAAFHELDALEAELEEAAAAMHLGTPESIQHHAELLEHYARRGGFERRSRKDAVTLAFGFRGRENDATSKLSGGERTRLGLAALLVENPDVLLLDEPTNHLDIVMVEWLEAFLSRYPGAVLVISHDRAFLDAATNETAHLWRGEVKVYPAGYSAFRTLLDEELMRQQARAEQDAKKVATLAASAARMKIWGLGMSKLARRASSMETRLERLKKSAASAPPRAERTARILFHAPPSGDIILDARHLTKRLAGRTLFENVQVQIRQGERVALVGRNGAGKTTFFRVLLGLMPSDDPRGESRTGARVTVGYYDQQLRGVDESSTLYHEAREYVEKDAEAHDLLGTYMFPYLSHDKSVKVLSGGERARLALLKLAQEDHNFLVLDEPTNHLDMEMLESLEGALDDFGGTLLMVSHDRRLIEHLADRIWLLEDGQFYEYPGGWQYYREKHRPAEKEAEAKAAPVRQNPANPKGKGLWHLKREVERLEVEVAQLEAQLDEAQNALAHAAPTADFAALGQQAAELEERLLTRMEEWEKAQVEVEARS
ncbi:ABC transporter ATP-binding protein [Deinococcus psychrotolerans]|uniref:ABC transporter ATP-binding protein n=1 Tax=Deinococcus psychrotolerans TaxID=2489213 RepID=A0A3G8YA75_9DEIO|nr:ABC-F family ATP-binding cassette domain-containing protein [Deinococcus psychrotolerans]AZI41830.1 ABC transporter ATP-binding protein [Deinococcus psychrotolerans]